MVDVLTEQNCQFNSYLDMVGAKFGEHKLLFYYYTALEICHSTSMAARMAMRYEGVRSKHWREQSNLIELEDPTDRVQLNRKYRRSGLVSNVNNWDVIIERNLVVYLFDDRVIKFHYSDALPIHTMLRKYARDAKRWAGDRSRIKNVRAHLTDAEENDKFVYVS